MNDQELARALFEAGLLTQEQVQTAASQRTATRNFAQIVVDMGWVTPAQIAQFDPNALGGQAAPPPMPPAGGPWQGNNPYPNTPPNYNAPHNNSPTSKAVVDLSAISEGWQLVSSQLGVWIGAVLVAYVIQLAVGQVIGLVLRPLMPMPQTVINPQNPFGSMTSTWVGMLPFIGISSLLQIPVTAFFYGGITIMGLNQLRRGTINFGDLFSAGPYIVPLMIATLLFQIGTWLGSIALCVGAFIIAGLLMFTIPLVVDRKLGPIEALSQSFSTLQGQLFSSFLVMLVLFILQMVGFLLCCVGVLVTAPVAAATIIVLYNRFFPASLEPQAPQTNYPPPPIPSPF